MLAFSLFPILLQPVLLLTQPKAALHTVEPTWGQGGRPNTLRLTRRCWIALHSFSGLRFSIRDNITFGLIELCCNALGWPWRWVASWGVFSVAATITALTCSVAGADMNKVLWYQIYGHGFGVNNIIYMGALRIVFVVESGSTTCSSAEPGNNWVGVGDSDVVNSSSMVS
jgi:hypothetical protein